MILTLDIATVSGWAFAAPGSRSPMFGEHRMGYVRCDEAIVFDSFDHWLRDKLDALKPAYVFAEDQFVPPKASREVMRRLMGMRAICAVQCYRHDVRLRWVPVQTVQRFFTAFGRWPKGEKKAATIRVCNLYGWRPETDNQADALALWLWGEHQVSPGVAGQRSMGPLFAKGGLS